MPAIKPKEIRAEGEDNNKLPLIHLAKRIMTPAAVLKLANGTSNENFLSILVKTFTHFRGFILSW